MHSQAPPDCDGGEHEKGEYKPPFRVLREANRRERQQQEPFGPELGYRPDRRRDEEQGGKEPPALAADRSIHAEELGRGVLDEEPGSDSRAGCRNVATDDGYPCRR